MPKRSNADFLFRSRRDDLRDRDATHNIVEGGRGFWGVTEASFGRGVFDKGKSRTMKNNAIAHGMGAEGLMIQVQRFNFYENPGALLLNRKFDTSTRSVCTILGGFCGVLRSSNGLSENSGLTLHRSRAFLCRLSSSSRLPRLPSNHKNCDDSDQWKHPFGGFIPTWRLVLCGIIAGSGGFLVFKNGERKDGSERTWTLFIGAGCYADGFLSGLAPWGKTNSRDQYYCGDKGPFHFCKTKPRARVGATGRPTLVLELRCRLLPSKFSPRAKEVLRLP